MLLLALFGTTVYVATLKGQFEVQKSIIINSPRATLFNYVNDFRNWETFGSWKIDDPQMKFSYPKNTVGTGGSYSWEGKDGEGNMKNTAVSANKFVRQQMQFEGVIATGEWIFKDTTGGTKVTWKSKGTAGFFFKMRHLLLGGSAEIFGDMQERSLSNLGKTINYELNTYKIKVNGLVRKSGTFYLKQTITSTIANVPYNLRILIPRMISFFTKNNLTMAGHPFVVYHTYDKSNGITKFSVCIPVKDEIHISAESDMQSGLLYPFQGVKTTLTGDYSHRDESWKKTTDYIKKNNLTENSELPRIEIYRKNMVQVANPSQWITEVLIPIKSGNSGTQTTDPSQASTTVMNSTTSTAPASATKTP